MNKIKQVVLLILGGVVVGAIAVLRFFGPKTDMVEFNETEIQRKERIAAALSEVEEIKNKPVDVNENWHKEL